MICFCQMKESLCQKMNLREHNVNYNSLFVTSVFFFTVSRLRIKIACKVHDEHKLVKDLPPPTEAVAKLAAKTLASNKPGKPLTFHCFVL